MKLLYLLLSIFLVACTLSCEKLDVEMPIQVVNLDGSDEANYFGGKVKNKLWNRNFIVVSHDTPLKLYIDDFKIRTYHTTSSVYDDCDGGYNSYTLEEEELDGKVRLMKDGRLVEAWTIQAANYDVLKEDDPLLIQLFFGDDEEDESCTDYWVKSKERMRANLRACARRVAADAAKKVNLLN